MKRRLLIIMLMLTALLLLLCGCVNARIDCSLGRDNEATLSYRVIIDKGDIPQTTAIKVTTVTNAIKRYWETAGFETDSKNTKDDIQLTAQMQKKEKDRGEAFDALLAMMESEVSPFTDVSGDYSESYFNDEYYLSASCDFSGVVPQAYMDALPYNIEDDVTEILQNSKVEIYLSLPGEVIETSGQETKEGCKITAGFYEPADIYVRTRLDNADNIAEYNGMLDLRKTSKNMIYIMGGAAIVSIILLALLIVFLIKNIRMNKPTAPAESKKIEVYELPEMPEQEDINEDKKS